MATPYNKDKFFVINKTFVVIIILLEVIALVVYLLVANTHDIYVCQQPKTEAFIVKDTPALECTKLK